MVENPYEKSLVKPDNSIFSKIKFFFKKLFNKNKEEQNVITKNNIEEKNIQIDKDNFINDIKMSVKTNLRLQKMSKDLESGEIIEEDLCEHELKELRDFYINQICEKKESIDNYKNKIMKIKAQLT